MVRGVSRGSERFCKPPGPTSNGSCRLLITWWRSWSRPRRRGRGRSAADDQAVRDLKKDLGHGLLGPVKAMARILACRLDSFIISRCHAINDAMAEGPQHRDHGHHAAGPAAWPLARPGVALARRTSRGRGEGFSSLPRGERTFSLTPRISECLKQPENEASASPARCPTFFSGDLSVVQRRSPTPISRTISRRRSGFLWPPIP